MDSEFLRCIYELHKGHRGVDFLRNCDRSLRSQRDLESLSLLLKEQRLKQVVRFDQALLGAMPHHIDFDIASNPVWHDKNVENVDFLDICSANGYRREAALNNLKPGEIENILLSIVFRRLNDPVREVRNAAFNFLKSHSGCFDSNFFIDAFLASSHTLFFGERIPVEYRESVLDTLVSPSHLPSLMNTIKNTRNASLGRFLLSQFSRCSAILFELEGIVDSSTALPEIRALAMSCLLNKKVSWAEKPQYSKNDAEGRPLKYRHKKLVIHTKSFTHESDQYALFEKASMDRDILVRQALANFFINERENLKEDHQPYINRLKNDESPAVYLKALKI